MSVIVVACESFKEPPLGDDDDEEQEQDGHDGDDGHVGNDGQDGDDYTCESLGEPPSAVPRSLQSKPEFVHFEAPIFTTSQPVNHNIGHLNSDMEDNLKILILNRSDCQSLIAFDGKVTGRFVPEIELDHPTLKIDLD